MSHVSKGFLQEFLEPSKLERLSLGTLFNLVKCNTQAFWACKSSWGFICNNLIQLRLANWPKALVYVLGMHFQP
jgi:hypothetical protein